MKCTADNWQAVLEAECGIPADGWHEQGAGIWEQAPYSVIEPRCGRRGTAIVAPACILKVEEWRDLPRTVKALQAAARAAEAVLSPPPER